MPRLDADQRRRTSACETAYFLSLQTLLSEFVTSHLSVIVHHVYGVFVTVRLDLSDEVTVLTDDSSLDYFFIYHLESEMQPSYLPVLAAR